MTFSAIVGVIATLGLVLGLLAITLRLLRKVTVGAAASRGAIRLEVVQRLALGPRQGIAVVRVGSQLIAVSVGDGGVRSLLDVPAEDCLSDGVVPAVRNGHAANGVSRDFKTMLRDGLRSSGLPFVALMMAAALAIAPAVGAAQATTARPPAAPAVARTAPAPAIANPAPAPSTLTLLEKSIPQLDLKVAGGKDEGGLRLSGTVGIVVMMALMTLLPTLLLMMTSFTRILIVMHFLKQALGTQNAPPAHLVSALALLLTGFVMAPTLSEVNKTAVAPWLAGTIDQSAMMSAAVIPFRGFMLKQTRERDLVAFIEMSHTEPPKRPEDIPTVVLMSAFVTSELRAAFQIGFALFLPFIVIDLVVSSVLMSMGMFMLPPAMISLPFKLLLFVLVDGWTLVIQSVVAGFKT